MLGQMNAPYDKEHEENHPRALIGLLLRVPSVLFKKDSLLNRIQVERLSNKLVFPAGTSPQGQAGLEWMKMKTRSGSQAAV